MNEIPCSSRITNVTIYPQAARVFRKASGKLKSGENLLIIENLPQGLSDDSFKAQVPTTLRILEFSIENRIRYAQSGAAQELETRIEELENCALRLCEGLKFKDREFQVFSDRDSLTELIDRENPKVVNPVTWGEFLDFLEKKLLDNRRRAREDYLAYLETLEELQAKKQELAVISSQQTWSEKIARVLIQSPDNNDAEITLVYHQTGVSWHPAYTLRFLPEEKVVDLNFYAMIRQETGELWENVGLDLSTAMPLDNCVLPVLKSKRLRETQSQIPIIQAATPAPMEVDDAFAQDMPRLADEKAKERRAPSPMKKSVSRAVSMKLEAEEAYFSRPGGGAPAPISAAASIAPPSPIPRPPSGRSDSPSDVFSIYEEFGNLDQKFIGDGINRPSLFHEWAQFQTMTRIILPPEISAGANEYFQNGPDPSLSCGGYDYRYHIQKSLNTLHSAGNFSQVPVEVRRLPITLSYVAMACESQLVYLRAKFQNSGSPLLQGPGQVFMGNDFICSLQVNNIASGQETFFSLGVDKDIQILRKEEIKTRTKGLGFKDLITDFEITLEALNSKSNPIELELYDRIPRPDHEKAPQAFDVIFSRTPDRESERGILLWKLTLKPKEKLVITMKYSFKVGQDNQLILMRSSQAHEGYWKDGRP